MSRSRKKTVSRDRRRSSSTRSLTGFSGVGWVGRRLARVGVRIAVGEEEEIAPGLRAVAQGVREQVAEAGGHAPERQAAEPGEEADGGRDSPDHDEHVLLPRRLVVGVLGHEVDEQDGREVESRERQHHPEGGLPPVLPPGRCDLEVDRVAAGLADEARGTGSRPGRRTRRRGSCSGRSAAKKSPERPRQRPAHEREDPGDRRDREERDRRPEREPDQVRDREEEPEEDRQPRAPQVVLDDHPDRVRLHRTWIIELRRGRLRRRRA